MVQRFGRQSVVLRQAIRRVLRIREQAAAFAEHFRVEVDERLPQADVFVAVREVTVFRSTQLVGCTVLMNEPRHLVRMADEIRRKLRSDDQVDRFAIRLAQIDEAPRGGVRKNFPLRIPLEWNADQLGLISAGAQLMMQCTHMVLRAAMDEGNLYLTNDDAANTHRREGILYLVGGWWLVVMRESKLFTVLSSQWRTPIVYTLLVCIVLYAALLRLDALFKSYGPYEQPRWLAAMQPFVR